MTESTGVKKEMHCHSGFLAIFGTIKQQIKAVTSCRTHKIDQQETAG